MRILAIETSCDETAAAIVEDGVRVLSNVIASQAAAHAHTGGVVPEVAAREHERAILPTIEAAMRGFTWDDIDAIAVTQEPGLTGSLTIGRMTAATLAFAHDKPLFRVNHVHGHIYSSWLSSDPLPQFPVLTLTVSGGHNELVLLRAHGDMQIVADTLDDSAGEAFDKVARLLGLGYPGGPAIERAAQTGDARAFDFPVALPKDNVFSFSGLKTSVLYMLKAREAELSNPAFVSDVAASFQDAVIQALVQKLLRAVRDHAPQEVHLTGGVSANQALRTRIQKELTRLPKPPRFRAPLSLETCTDNAAMIGAAAYWEFGHCI